MRSGSKVAREARENEFQANLTRQNAANQESLAETADGSNTKMSLSATDRFHQNRAVF